MANQPISLLINWKQSPTALISAVDCVWLSSECVAGAHYIMCRRASCFVCFGFSHRALALNHFSEFSFFFLLFSIIGFVALLCPAYSSTQLVSVSTWIECGVRDNPTSLVVFNMLKRFHGNSNLLLIVTHIKIDSFAASWSENTVSRECRRDVPTRSIQLVANLFLLFFCKAISSPPPTIIKSS